MNPIRAMKLANKYLYSSSPLKTVADVRTFLESLGNPDYVYITPASVQNKNPAVVITMTVNFAALVHQASTKTKVLAQININPKDPTSEIYCDLSLQSNRDILASSMAAMVNTYMFDGVYFDFEPLQSGAVWLPTFIQNLKTQMNGKKVFGYCLRIADVGTEYWWTIDYIQSVAAAADGVEISLYNTGIKTVKEYQAFIYDQIDRVKSAGLIDKVLFVLPAYPANANHDPAIENIVNAFPIVLKYNTGLFSQYYATPAELAAYITILATYGATYGSSFSYNNLMGIGLVGAFILAAYKDGGKKFAVQE